MMRRRMIQQRSGNKVRNHFQLLCLVLFMSCISGNLTAQQVGYATDDSRGDWFVGIGAGPRIYFADHAKQLNLYDRISGGGDIYIGRWWNPIFGTRIGASWQTLKGAALDPGESHGTAASFRIPDGKYGRTTLYKQRFDAGHLYADLLVNISTAFNWLNENRFWTLTPFVGLGYISTWEKPQAHEVSFSIGMLNSLRVGKAIDLNLDIRGAMMRDRFHTTSELDMGERPFDGILSVNLGLVFYFGGGGSRPKPVYRSEPVYTYTPQREPNTEVITEWIEVATDVLVLFQIGQSTLSKDARVQLGFLAKLMQQYPESQYIITGYADEGTGNPDLNYRLSNERAKRVKDCLTSEFGIAPSRLKTVAAGGVENRYYNDPSLSRSAIIRPDKY